MKRFLSLLLAAALLCACVPALADDVRLSDLENSLQVHIDIVKSSGWDFVEGILGEKVYE